ncbi:hypothetical protein HOLleu_11441 [Holothuria leucospilota]|uniref:Uncharacterized protein n=1 Tax=Holothuria leucospilota TaxID=206669 RepID=A0A9Q1CF81_HOLLE|nr:hypothetical protein HOLleu_11441 [Holothuria leucospilota]
MYTKCVNFPPMTKISLEIPKIPGKEPPCFPTFSTQENRMKLALVDGGRVGGGAYKAMQSRDVAMVGCAGRPHPALDISARHYRQTHVSPPTTNLPTET